MAGWHFELGAVELVLNPRLEKAWSCQALGGMCGETEAQIGSEV